ncbi:hypothetical protein HDU96_000937 [Phlyctochytrium bullatum]|nr:hypothetical protein HDU96_000937 [Phlyctochytrium bullatum]
MSTKGFRTVINNAPPAGLGATSAEVLAKYCDWILKKTSKVQFSEGEIEAKLSRVVSCGVNLSKIQLILFEYVEDKDVFQKFYSRLLAKRLIFSASVSDEAESNMITRLKNICGFEYTAKLQRMFTDMALSGDVNRQFVGDLGKKSITLPIDFSILVLTAGSWPLSNNAADVLLPGELDLTVAEFSRFYNTLHNGPDVRVNFADKRYELNVSLHQLCLLRLFNDADKYDLSELVNLTKFSEADLRRIMKATIVRIMKSRKTITHPLLIQETIDHSKSRFIPSVALVKKSIEKLIEKGYMARSEELDVYVYKTLTHNITLHPQYFGARMQEFLVKRLYEEVEGTCSGRHGYVISVVEVVNVGRGTLQSTSGYAEFNIIYKAIVFKPFRNQVVDGTVTTVNKARELSIQS